MVSWKYSRNNAATAFESIIIPNTVYPGTLKILKSSKSKKNQIYFAYHSIHRSFQNFRQHERVVNRQKASIENRKQSIGNPSNIDSNSAN